MNIDTTSQTFFENKYRQDLDPWAFASSEYELSRYAATMDALGPRRYRRAFEPGCSIGVLTTRLAAICDHLDAVDISPTAVQRARQSCRHLPNVNILCGTLLNAIPSGTFDLVVLSEIGYYFSEDQLLEVGKQLVDRLQQAGTLLAVHWLGASEDHILSGDRVHEILASLDGLDHAYSERNPGQHAGFRLDRWTRL